MFGRTVMSGGAGLIIAVLLFLAMHALTTRSERPRLRSDAYPVIDFVRLTPEPPPPPER